jgi:predicted RNase H-like nuclease (RuvC/YqgF family)
MKSKTKGPPKAKCTRQSTHASENTKDRRIQHQQRLIATLQRKIRDLEACKIRLETDYDSLQLELAEIKQTTERTIFNEVETRSVQTGRRELMTKNKSDKLFARLAFRNQAYARGRRMQRLKRLCSAGMFEAIVKGLARSRAKLTG